jgi:hypothetical protein
MSEPREGEGQQATALRRIGVRGGALLGLPDTKIYGTEAPAGGLRVIDFDRGKFVMSTKAQQPNWVTAVFQNAAVSIEIAHQTTLAQLAEQLGALGELHGKLIFPVRVRLPS